MTVIVRQLRISDVEQVDQILMAAFQESSFKDELKLYLKLQPDGWLVAQEDQTILGMVGAVHYSSVAHVGLMAVHPVFQGQGVGSILLESLLDQLEYQRCSIIRLEARFEIDLAAEQLLAATRGNQKIAVEVTSLSPPIVMRGVQPTTANPANIRTIQC